MKNEQIEQEMLTSYEEMPVMSLLGPISVGKSCLAHRYIFGEFPEQTEPTVGKNINSYRLHHGGLVIGEVGGHDLYHDMWKDVIQESDMVAYCFSSENVNNPEFKDDLDMLENLILPYLKKQPLVIFITKLDLAGEQERFKVVNNARDELKKHFSSVSKNIKWNVFGCSALNGWGIHNGITWLFANLSTK
ncbi:MAG: ADP-ribosylation factor-like protein [Candidatus Hodarchaeales archaeon]|jgi:ADP-ribosylation factor-like protein 1